MSVLRSFAFVLVATWLAACGATADEKIVGSWTGTYKTESLGYEFKADGTGNQVDRDKDPITSKMIDPTKVPFQLDLTRPGMGTWNAIGQFEVTTI